VVLVAHSFGGLLGIAYALRHDDQLDKAVFSAPLLKVKIAVPGWKRAVGRILPKVAPRTALSNEVDPALLSHDPAVATGKQLFTTLACAGCHTVQGLTGGKVGPELTHLMSQKTPLGGVAGLDVNEANLVKWVGNAPGLKPGIVMPAFGKAYSGPLDDAQILSIVKFLETLK